MAAGQGHADFASMLYFGFPAGAGSRQGLLAIGRPKPERVSVEDFGLYIKGRVSVEHFGCHKDR